MALNDNSEPDADTVTFRPQLCKLKQHLECQRHHGQYCYVSPVDGTHLPCDIYKLTLWAKQIVSLQDYDKISCVLTSYSLALWPHNISEPTF